jgi:type IV fimbrial biogenesis protein FimT
VPLYGNVIAEQRNRAAANELHSALVLARSEAVKRNARVTLSPMPTWTQGWRIVSPVAGQPDLLSHTRPAGISIASDAEDVTFTASGRTTAQVAFEVISDSNSSSVRCLNLGVDGRASVEKGECDES